MKGANKRRLAEVPFRDLRILEIGQTSLFRHVVPNTTFVDYGWLATASPDQPDHIVFAAHRVPSLLKKLRDPDLDLVILHLTRHGPWSLRSLRAGLRLDPKTSWRLPFWRSFAPWLTRVGRRAPLVGVDIDDAPFLPQHMHSIVRRSVVTFKRELPADRWLLLAYQFGGQEVPSLGRRKRPDMVALLDKLEPISLGAGSALLAHAPPEPMAKRSDIFFAGNADHNATIRARSVAEARALATRGVTIDFPDRLPLDEFARRCAQAWLVLSPQGFGWDCYRHYEAPACWSVPLINQPAIECHAPLLNGTHAHFYDARPGALSAVALAALADKPRLMEMARAARHHVMQNHTPEALCRYIVTRTAAILDQQAGVSR